MNAIITVVGKDKVGIIAGVCNTLAGVNVNVLDIRQTVFENMFNMNMLVSIEEATVGFSEIVSALGKEGERLGVSIRIQREDIFDAMHKI